MKAYLIIAFNEERQPLHSEIRLCSTEVLRNIVEQRLAEIKNVKLVSAWQADMTIVSAYSQNPVIELGLPWD